MIPTTLADWLSGGPWLINRDHFFLNAEEVLAGRKEKPSAFTIQNGRKNSDNVYEDRSAHEIAHLICCSDADIFDPYWGMPEFNFDNGTKEGVILSLEVSKKEIEVCCVQERIDIHIRNWEPRFNEKITPRYMYPLVRNGNTIPEGLTEYQFLIRQCDWALNRWSDIQTIWNELQRKYALVAASL